ncbi:MAG: phosphatidylserine decarboxylase family protein [Thermodesulfobacteriota bacterium]
MRRGPIAAPGCQFILAGGIMFFFGWWLLSWTWLAVLGLVAAAFFAYFFRDPERSLPAEAGAIVSPADGKVILLDEVREDKFLEAPAKRVGIFMNVFDVHVNRAPVAGKVAASQHYPGRFVAAFRAEADRVNERQVTLLEREGGGRVLMLQIAGLLARRIISYVKEEDRLARGERLGLICFGSRVDLYLPLDAEVLVKVGDRVRAGSSIVGRWPEN